MSNASLLGHLHVLHDHQKADAEKFMNYSPFSKKSLHTLLSYSMTYELLHPHLLSSIPTMLMQLKEHLCVSLV